MNFRKIIFTLFILLAMAVQARVPRDTITVSTYYEDYYDGPERPRIEFKASTYHNFFGSTTAGYKLVLRGSEIELKGATLHKGDSVYQLLSPFDVHVGDSTVSRRIDHVFVIHKFPFTDYFTEDDSMVVHTDRGDFSVYWNDDRYASSKYTPMIHSLNKKLSTTYIALFIVAFAIIIGALAVYYVLRLKRSRREGEMNRLLCLLSENEMRNRELNASVTALFRDHFATINRLCYEYFEKSDTPFAKRSIYNQVEQEIMRLREPSQLLELEEALNRYCNGIMQRLRQQLPDLSDKERTLLIYLYSGLSARTICTLTDIQIKNFYMRRQRLKTKILASTAPDRNEFASQM